MRALSKAAVTGDIVKAFKIGLYFRLTLLRQDVPGLDDLLDRSFPFASMNSASIAPALRRGFTARFWRALKKDHVDGAKSLQSDCKSLRLAKLKYVRTSTREPSTIRCPR